MGVRNMAHQRPPPQDGQWHPELLISGRCCGEKAKTSRAMAGMEPYAPRGAGPAPKEKVHRPRGPARLPSKRRNAVAQPGVVERAAGPLRESGEPDIPTNTTQPLMWRDSFPPLPQSSGCNSQGTASGGTICKRSLSESGRPVGTTRRTAAQTVFFGQTFSTFYIYSPSRLHFLLPLSDVHMPCERMEPGDLPSGRAQQHAVPACF